MNRRKAIGRIFLVGGAGAAAFSGYKWYDWNKFPDIAYIEQKKDLIAALAETIIPATDTPGAREAGVADYIITMIRDCTERKTQNKFINGIKELESYCHSNYNKPYTQCSGDEQRQTLQYFAKQGKPSAGLIGKAQNKFLGKSFFSTLKEYTVAGYCTSEPGATKTLSYVLVPGRYEGCMPMQPGQKTWATK